MAPTGPERAPANDSTQQRKPATYSYFTIDALRAWLPTEGRFNGQDRRVSFRAEPGGRCVPARRHQPFIAAPLHILPPQETSAIPGCGGAAEHAAWAPLLAEQLTQDLSTLRVAMGGEDDPALSLRACIVEPQAPGGLPMAIFTPSEWVDNRGDRRNNASRKEWRGNAQTFVDFDDVGDAGSASGDDEFRGDIFTDDAFNFPTQATAGAAGGGLSAPAPAAPAPSTLKRDARGAAVGSGAAVFNEAREREAAYLRQFPYADNIDEEATQLLNALGFLVVGFGIVAEDAATGTRAVLLVCGGAAGSPRTDLSDFASFPVRKHAGVQPADAAGPSGRSV